MPNQYSLRAKDLRPNAATMSAPAAKVEQPPVAPGGNMLLQDVPVPAGNPVDPALVAQVARDVAALEAALTPGTEEFSQVAAALEQIEHAVEPSVEVVAPPAITVQDGAFELLP